MSKIFPQSFKMSLLKICSLTVILSICCLSQSQARWSNEGEADVVYENFEDDVTVYKGGRVVLIRTIDAKALNERGRERLGTNRFTYNSNIETIEILEASAIFEGKKYDVPKKMIEKKPLASQGAGFDQLNQFLISFPKIGVGTQIHIKYKITTNKQPLPNYYTDMFQLGDGALWNKATIRLRSELPFHKLVNDPRNSLLVTESKEGKFQKLTISLQKPLYESVTNEMTFVPDHLRTWVKVSTLEKVDDIGNAIASHFESVLKESLPPLLESIKEEAAKEKTPVEQMNKVSSLLAESVRYMGDWRTIEGKFTPHSLKEITKNGVGDCKDFSVAMGAILKKLGFDVHVTLVARGDGYLSPTKFLPTLSLYNHAMLKVQTKEGKVYWIDPTNFVTMSDGVFSDISNRPCLVLSPKESKAEFIPAISPIHSFYEIDKKLSLQGENGLLTQGKLALRGEEAVRLTGAALINSISEIEDGMLLSLSKDPNAKNKKIVFPDLTSRIVKDISITYQFEQEDCVLMTNGGHGIMLDSPWCKPYLSVTPDQVGTLFVGTPSQMSRTIHILNNKIKDIEKLDFMVKTPWLEVNRKCISEKDDVIIRETITLLKSFISAEEVASPQYKDLQKILRTYCTNVAVILN